MRIGLGIWRKRNLSLGQHALSVLGKYGTNAHLYLPGIGMIDGVTAGNYLDSAGATAASVGGLVGLVKDSLGAGDASQSTGANRPTLRKSGNHYWEFNGSSNYLSLSAPLFQMSDDHAVVAGAVLNASTGFQSVFSEEGVGRIQIRYQNGNVQFIWLGSSTGTNFQTAGQYVGTPIVIGARNRSGTKASRVNGLTLNIDSTPTDNPNLTAASLGNWSNSNFFSGSLYPIIAIKGTVSDAELLTLERWVGSLTGPTGVIF